MTYKELNDRLTKCESALQKIKNGSYTPDDSTNLKETTKRLNLLRESLQKQIAEAEETMFVSTKGGDTKAVQMDRKNAMDLKKDPDITSIDTAKGQSIKEDIKFSVEETKAIAKKVGEAVAKSLKEAGDEISTMKAKRIEPNSFEIYVEYKKDIATDEFSFYITDDTLHLTDFSFDKELTDVGVKPSGEAILNVDVLANELKKHFASMREMKNPGYASSSQSNQYAGRAKQRHSKEKKDAHKQTMKDFSQRLKDKGIAEAPDNMYYIKIPRDASSQNKAQVIFNNIYGIDYQLNDDPDGIIMYFEKEKFNPGLLDDLEGDMVKILDTNIPNINEDAEEDAKNDADYEAGWHDDPRKDEDVDVGHQDDEPDMLQSTAFETAQYAAKLVKKLQKYDNFDGEVDFPNWWQSKLILAKDYMQKAYHYLDSEEKQPAIDQLALEGDGMTTKIKPSEGDPTNMAYTDKVKEGRGDGEAINNIIIGMANEDGISTGEAAQEIIDHITHIFIDTKGTDEGKYKSDAQRKAIYATKAEKEGVNEVDGDRFVRAAFEDLEQVIRNLAHTAEISEDEALEMAIRKLEAMLDGRDDMDEGVAKTKKAHDLVVNKMKELAKKYKEGDKSVVDQLKDLTAKKKSLEAMLDKDVAGTGKDQELEEADLDKKQKKQVKKIVKQLKKSVKGHGDQAKYLSKLSKESAPGYKHDCAAKVVHEKYGAGTCIPEKHTLVKEGKKYVVTHYDILFESGRTVEDIPVSELDIKTSNEHWHKGYKKKKK